MSEDTTNTGVATELTKQEDPAALEQELRARSVAFIEAYGKLVEEHKMDFASYPMFVPEDGKFVVKVQTTPVDVRSRPMKTPFIPDAK